MKTYYISATGMDHGEVQYGEKYKHLAAVTVELPTPEEKEGYQAIIKYNPDTREAYWEYVEAIYEPSPEEEMAQLRIEMAQANTELFEMVMLMTGGGAN